MAMFALTGCGDDDKKGAPATPSISMPPLPSLKPLTPPPINAGAGRISASASMDAGAAAPSARPTSSGSSAGARQTFEIGDCFNSFTKGVFTKVPCSAVHSGEVAALFTLPDSMNPSSPTYTTEISKKCQELLVPVLDRQPNKDELAYASRGPTVATWNNEKDRRLECVMTGKGNAKLNAPLVK